MSTPAKTIRTEITLSFNLIVECTRKKLVTILKLRLADNIDEIDDVHFYPLRVTDDGNLVLAVHAVRHVPIVEGTRDEIAASIADSTLTPANLYIYADHPDHE